MLPIGSSEYDALLRKLSNQEKMIGYILANLYKEIATISDNKILIMNLLGNIITEVPMGSLAFFDRFHHMARSSTRAGILKMLSPIRDFWINGFDMANISKNENAQPNVVGEHMQSRIKLLAG